MAKNMKSHGWQYVIVDIQWSEQNPKTHGYRPNADLKMDEYGRLIPAPNRFPSSADGKGFKPLADYVHSRGLKFGIHIMRGIPRKAVDANLPILNSQLKAGDVANKESICRWNSDMYGSIRRKAGRLITIRSCSSTLHGDSISSRPTTCLVSARTAITVRRSKLSAPRSKSMAVQSC